METYVHVTGSLPQRYPQLSDRPETSATSRSPKITLDRTEVNSHVKNSFTLEDLLSYVISEQLPTPKTLSLWIHMRSKAPDSISEDSSNHDRDVHLQLRLSLLSHVHNM